REHEGRLILGGSKCSGIWAANPGRIWNYVVPNVRGNQPSQLPPGTAIWPALHSRSAARQGFGYRAAVHREAATHHATGGHSCAPSGNEDRSSGDKVGAAFSLRGEPFPCQK